MSKSAEKIEEGLKALGFVQGQDQDDSLILRASSPSQAGGRSTKPIPWSIDRWHVARWHGEWVTDSITFSISLKNFAKQLQHSLQEVYGQQTQLDMVPALGQGIWILVELTHSRVSKDLTKKHENHECAHFPHGIVGFHFDIAAEGPQLLLQVSKHFLIGYVPTKIFCEIPSLILKCLDFKHERITSELGVFETQVNFEKVLEYVIEQSRNPELLREVGFKAKESKIDFNGPIHLKCSFIEDSGWSIGLTAAESSYVSLDVPPIEIVETRDLETKFAYIDRLILSQKMEAAKKLCLSALEEGETSLFIYRRLCVIHFWLKKPMPQQHLNEMLLQDPDNLMFLSTAVQSALLSENRADLLKYLSKLGQLLQERIADFDEISTFEMVIPELLGDGWSQVDLNTAQVCYQRVVQRRGDVPRVLRKMVGIAREIKDPLSEIRLLSRLVEVENRKSRVAESYLRLAELYRDNDPHLASENAITGWKLTPTNVEYAHYAADCLVHIEEFQKGIRILDDCLKLIDRLKDDQKKSQLELKIARIWFKKLNRKDLAKLRLERAIKLIPKDLDNLMVCENLAKDMGFKALVLSLLESIFYTAIEQKLKDQVFRSLAELMELYKDRDDREHKISSLYQTMIEHYLVSADELYTLLSMPNLAINWHTLINNVKNHIAKEAIEGRQPYYIFLGELATQKLKDKAMAAEFFEQSMDYGKASGEVYDFLNVYYSSQKMIKKRDALLKKQLTELKGPERKSVLEDLFYTSGTFSDPELDGYAILMLKELSDEKPLKKRLSIYQDQSDIRAIDRVLEDLKSELKDHFDRNYWLKYSLELLRECRVSSRFDLIEKILQEIKDDFPDKFEWFELGVACHKDDLRYKHLEPYLHELVMNGIPPKMDADVILEVLKSSSSKGLYYRYLANQETNPRKASSLLRKSLKLLVKVGGYDRAVFKIYEQLSDVVPLDKDEIQQFYKRSKVARSIETFATCMDHQLSMISSHSQFKRVKPTLIEMFQDHNDRVFDVVDSYLENIALYQESELHDQHMFLFKSNEEYRKLIPESWGLDYLKSMDYLMADLDFYAKIMKWLLEEPRNRTQVEQIVETKQHVLLEKGDYQNLQRYAELSLGYDISFSDVLWALFRHCYREGDIDRALHYWLLYLEQLNSRNSWEKFYHDTQDFLSDDERLKLFLKEAHKVIERIPERIQQDVKMEYALCLFSADENTKEVHQILHEIYQNDNNIDRIWIPLYFLKSTLSLKAELYELLYEIIPKINHNLELLGSFPLTMESLLKDFRGVARELDKSDVLPNFKLAKPKRDHRPMPGATILDFSEQAEALSAVFADGGTGLVFADEFNNKDEKVPAKPMTPTAVDDAPQESVKTQVLEQGSKTESRQDLDKTSIVSGSINPSPVSPTPLSDHDVGDKHTRILDLDEVLAKEKEREATQIEAMPLMFSRGKKQDKTQIIEQPDIPTKKKTEFGEMRDSTAILDLGDLSGETNIAPIPQFSEGAFPPEKTKIDPLEDDQDPLELNFGLSIPGPEDNVQSTDHDQEPVIKQSDEINDISPGMQDSSDEAVKPASSDEEHRTIMNVEKDDALHDVVRAFLQDDETQAEGIVNSTQEAGLESVTPVDQGLDTDDLPSDGLDPGITKLLLGDPSDDKETRLFGEGTTAKADPIENNESLDAAPPENSIEESDKSDDIFDSEVKVEDRGKLEDASQVLSPNKPSSEDQETKIIAKPKTPPLTPRTPEPSSLHEKVKVWRTPTEVSVANQSIPPVTPPSKPPIPDQPKLVVGPDWRVILRGFDEEKLLSQLKEVAYPSRLEKYLAIQGGVFHDQEGFNLLSEFNWLDFVEPWKGPQKDEGTVIPNSPLTMAIKFSRPEIVQSYQRKVNLHSIAESFHMPIDKFLAEREYIKFTDLFAWPWAETYEQQLQDIPIELVFIDNTEQVIYESRQRVLYIGKALAISPSPRLLFKVLFEVRAIQINMLEFINQPELVMQVLKRKMPDFERDLRREIAQLVKDESALKQQVDQVKDHIVRQLLKETRNLIDLVRFDRDIFGYSSTPEKRKRILLSLISKIK
ncbi:hypothetical protein [Pseudobacteriovorax antillogorgiicola]|uniref:Uncharacterized protein n=1 Tax=Pseudobacteriovorax antillogorgiicola TaxID=1513793 RepID=A0A1Y6BQB0_9BACT|nr:hypothetical protein [Pseudobacteriovorax antillogorgiicola]TCS55326.1 hypothetical protein EDD56_10547 [Pseudobacteriovorax antillogorgiicola]SMF14152.1 hypothetical protein SAMN06296036_105277 [Pseudobacteriovorax antillogorgiicola]